MNYSRKLASVAGVLFLLLALPHSQAALYTGGHVVIDTPRDESITIVSEQVTITAPIKGDLSIVSGEVHISSAISGASVIASGKFSSSGATFDSLRLVSGDTSLEHTKIQGTFTGIASQIKADGGTEFLGETILAGNDGSFFAKTKNLQLFFSHLLLAGQTEGSLTTTADEHHFLDTFSVKGNYVQQSDHEMKPADSLVTGNYDYKTAPHLELPKIFPELRDPKVFFFMFLWILVVNSIGVFFFSSFFNKRVMYMKDHPLESFLTGMVWLILIPVVSFFGFALVFGMLASFIVMGFYLLFLMLLPSLLSFLYGSVLLSSRYHPDERPSKKILWLVSFFGALTFLLIQLVPVVGVFANILLGAIAIGGVLQNDDTYFGVVSKK